jgi:hypothetical protein
MARTAQDYLNRHAIYEDFTEGARGKMGKGGREERESGRVGEKKIYNCCCL